MKKIIILLTGLLFSLSSQATILSVELNQDSYQVGDVLTANFTISDIEDDSSGFQKLLATFGFNALWDDTILEYSSFSFGNMLQPDSLNPSDQLIDVKADSLNLSEISYAWWDELLSVQDGLSSFVLASIDFKVIGSGMGNLNLTNVNFGDNFGDAFTNVNSEDKAYSVISGTPVDVPEPTVIVLMLMALTLLVRQRRVK